MSNYRLITEDDFKDSYGLGFRKYICKSSMCGHMTYVFWRDINEMTWTIKCCYCDHTANYQSGKLRPIALSGVKDVGYYDRALGQYIRNNKHKDQVMQQMGVRPISNSEIEDNMQEQMSDAIEHEQTVQTFSRTMRETNSFAAAARAISEE